MSDDPILRMAADAGLSPESVHLGAFDVTVHGLWFEYTKATLSS